MAINKNIEEKLSTKRLVKSKLDRIITYKGIKIQPLEIIELPREAAEYLSKLGYVEEIKSREL